MQRSQVPDPILQTDYEKLFASLQSLQTDLSNPKLNGNQRDIKINAIMSELKTFEDHAKARDLDVYPLLEVFNQLEALRSSSHKIIPSSLWDHFQEHIIDPIWNFHEHQILHTQIISPKKRDAEPYAALATEVVTALAIEECLALLETNAFIEGFSPYYAAAHKDLYPVVKNEDTILISQLLRDELNQRIHLESLPPEIFERITSHAGLQATGRLATTARMFKSVLDKDIVQLLQIHVRQGGSLEEVDKALTKNPYLLLIKVAGTDLLGHSNEPITLYQAALRSDDAEMVKVIQKHFANLEGGESIKTEQRDEEIAKWQNEPTFNFDSIVTAITVSSNVDVRDAVYNHDCQPKDTILWKALEKFREEFTMCALKENHFNPEHFLKACDIYNEKYKNKEWSLNQCNLFLRQVIGYVQRYAPAVHLQAFAQGLHYILNNNEDLHRIFSFRNDNGTILPRSADHIFHLGFDFAVVEGDGIKSFNDIHINRTMFDKYFKTNAAAIIELSQQQNLKPTSPMGK